MRRALLLLVVVVSASAAPVPKQVKKRADADVFVGAWLLDKKGGADTQWEWTFDAELTMWSRVEGSKEKGSEWKVTIDPDKTPKEFDLANGSTRYQGVYEIDGDVIRLAYGTTRPADLGDKTRNSYTVLRRAK